MVDIDFKKERVTMKSRNPLEGKYRSDSANVDMAAGIQNQEG